MNAEQSQVFWQESLAKHLIGLDNALDDIRVATHEGDWNRAIALTALARTIVITSRRFDSFIIAGSDRDPDPEPEAA